MSANLMSLARSGGKFLKLFGDRKMVKTMPTARDYVQDGLIGLWDGIENAGFGIHDSGAGAWKDLFGSNDCTPKDSTFRWTSDGFVCDGLGLQSAHSMSFKSVEVVVDIAKSDQKTTYCPIFGYLESGNAKGIFWLPSLNLLRFYSGSSRSWDTNNADRLIGTYSAVNISGSSTVMYNDGAEKPLSTYGYWNNVGYSADTFNIGGTLSNHECIGTIKCVRVYDSVLTQTQISANYEIDKARFNLP